MPTIEGLDILRESVEKASENVRVTLEEFKTAEGEERGKLAERLEGLEKQVTGLNSALKEAESRPNFSGVEVTKSGEKEKFSFGRAAQLVTGIAKATDKEYGYEMEVFKAGQEQMDAQPLELKTAVNAQTDAEGAFLIPTEVMDQIVPELESMEIAAQLGVTIINGLVGNVMWVKEEGSISAVYVDTEAEESGSESVTTFSNIELRPHVCGAFVPLTYQMLRQPAMAMDQFISQRIAKKIALREDLSVFLGTGSNSEPRGVFNDPGITTSTQDLVGLTNVGGTSDDSRAALIDAIDAVEDNDCFMNGRMGWAASNKVKYALAKVNDADGKPLYGSLETPSLSSLLGYPLLSSTQLKNTADATADRLIFGDWSEVVLGRWGTLALAASDTTETNFRKMRTTIRGIMAHDVAVLQPSCFTSILCDVDATPPFKA